MYILHDSSKQGIAQQDPEIYNIIQREHDLQKNSINLIPSETHTSKAVSEALGCVFSTRYAPGPQGKKYAPLVENYDEIEKICQDRALQTFELSGDEWGVNVQMGSGSTANLAIFLGVLQPKDRIMSMEFQQGGHFSHGYQIGEKKLSAVSKIFEVLFYQLHKETHLIDYDKVELLAQSFKPKLIVAGCSAYSQLVDFSRFRKICDSIGAILLADIAHTSGLMAAGVIPSPFQYADIVMTTTHKGYSIFVSRLRGPRGSLIFYKLKYKEAIDESVAPGLVAGAHFHSITGIAVALKETLTQEYKNFQQQVLDNNRHFASELLKLKLNLITGGTANHLILVDLRSSNIDSIKLEYVLSQINIQSNKNSIPYDTVTVPRALRIGSYALTARGATKEHFTKVAELIQKSVQLCTTIQTDLQTWSTENKERLEALKQQVIALANELPVPYVQE